MTKFRRVAMFQLAVGLATALAVGGIFLLTGQIRVSVAGFALLGLLGLGPLRARWRGEVLVEDEREADIARRAALLSYTVFWLCFVIWGVAVSLKYGPSGTVPVAAVEPVVWTGAWLVIVVRAISAVIFDTRGA